MGTVQALGPIVVTLENKAVVPIPGPRTREVVAALATGAGKPLARRTLWSWLWPDMPKDSARKALNTELWRLKQAVGKAGGRADDLILSTPHELKLRTDRGFDLDLKDFQKSITSATSLDKLLSAYTLYNGDFADGIEGEWTETIRRELRAAYLQLLTQIVDQALDANRLAEAQFFSDRLTREDPYDEKAARSAIRAALARGDHSAAAQMFRNFSDRLKDDLGIRPSAKTVALYQACRLGTGGPAPESGFRLERVPETHLAAAEARRKVLVIADLVTAIRTELRSLAKDLDGLDG